MTDLTTYAALAENFNDSIRPMVVATYGENDIPAMSEAWNNYTDAEAKAGALTNLEYHHCPHIDDIDDDTPSDNEEMLDYLLDQEGVTMKAEWVRTRDDGLLSECEPPMIHWRVTITNGRRSLTTYFSHGIANHPRYRQSTGYTIAIKEDMEKRADGRGLKRPEKTEVISCLLSDTAGELDDFEEWCCEYGLDDDSRAAERLFTKCQELQRQMAMLFGGTMDDLHQRAMEI